MSRLDALRSRIGGQVFGDRGVFPGPGHSRKDRSLSLMDAGGRIVAHSFAGDTFEEIRGYLFEHGVEITTAKDLTPEEKRAYAQARRAEKARRAAEITEQRRICGELWDAAEPLGAQAHTYFAARGLPAGVVDLAAKADLRFLPACPCAPYAPDGRTAPAVVARVTNPYGETLGLHLTFPGRYRLMLGPQTGGMVRLTPEAGETLAVAEGIETALAFSALHLVPCWAARSALGLEQFRPPPGVHKVIIAADGDAAGRLAAERLQVMLASFVRVERADAPEGLDWNDVLRGVGA